MHKKTFQVLSRPWKWLSEFSRSHMKTALNTVHCTEHTHWPMSNEGHYKIHECIPIYDVICRIILRGLLQMRAATCHHETSNLIVQQSLPLWTDNDNLGWNVSIQYFKIIPSTFHPTCHDLFNITHTHAHPYIPTPSPCIDSVHAFGKESKMTFWVLRIILQERWKQYKICYH